MPALRSEFAVLLRRLLVFMLVIELVFMAAFVLTGRFGLRNLNPLAMGIVTLLAYLELAAGRVRRGIMVLSWGLWFCVCAFSFVVAGTRTPALMGLPAMLIITAWVQGLRPAAGMAAATIGVIGVVAIFEAQGWLPPPVERTPFDMFLVVSASISLTTVLAVSLAENFFRHYHAEQSLTDQLKRRIEELNESERALRELNEALEVRVDERTVEYQAANESLRETLGRLEQTQAELIQSEKLAALGSMVAGVSHELSTPLGNALLVSTTLQHHLQEIEAGLKHGNFSKSGLQESLGQVAEAAQLMSRNVERAIGLVRSFKQTAVDQASQ